MKVLLVVHGYPPRYNAGSEVYTQTLARALARNHDVRVFSRFEDAALPLFTVLDENDGQNTGAGDIPVRLVNMAGFRDRFRHVDLDQLFDALLIEFRPDVVHIQHLNHLSTSLVTVVKSHGIPVVFTLHDYWLQCPRGQFIQAFPENPSDPLCLCSGQENAKCAARCYSRSFTGAVGDAAADLAYYTDWVHRRMAHVREVVGKVDLFLAPSRHVLDRFKRDLSISGNRIRLVEYGFDLNRLKGRRRVSPADTACTFGYIGTHVPAKGVAHLIDAVSRLTGSFRLLIWGRENAETTPNLRVRTRLLPESLRSRVEWMGEYENERIVEHVFNRVDAIVVPSLWLENAPLVIHEALQCRVAVVTADAGGMAEFVRHEENGLLFRHRNARDLSVQMQRLIDDPSMAARLGRRGHLYSATGDIVSSEDHVAELEAIYSQLIQTRSVGSVSAAPWRVTFDTNPDDCNLKCVMCEEHSPYSPKQEGRKACGLPRRRMDVAVVERVMQDLGENPPTEIIPSTMGEPLLYADFDQILSLCRRSGARLNLTTNGTFPRRGPREWGRLILPLASDVKISFNGMDDAVQEKIMQGAAASDLRSNIRKFVQTRDEIAASGMHRASITLQATFMEQNLAEMPNIVRFALEIGVDRVKGHQLWAHFAEIKGQDLRRSRDARARWNETVAVCHSIVAEAQRLHGMKLQLQNFTPMSDGESQAVPDDYVCPFLGKEAWVNHEGRFDPCCAPDELRKTLGSFGNVTREGLLGIWQSEAYRDLVANYRTRSLCRTCLMRQRPAPAPTLLP
ncbi:MAG: glycosyltransferase [Verrucomicrobia bacterium]|nr:glycosyltransferase [Verrucomicrobiota bacterium]